jgi:integrase
MSKTLHETTLSTRAARGRLSEGLHWRSLDRDVHLGYRKGVRTGRWLVRWRTGVGYKQAPLANADDALDADGKETLSFDQALKGARDHVVRMRAGPAEKQPGPAPKVREAALAYAAAIDTRQKAAGGFVWGDTRSRLKNYVLSHAIANIELPKLTEAHIQTWRESLGSRKLSPASVKRVSSMFRAVLYEAGRKHRRQLGGEFRSMVRDAFEVSTQERAAIATRPNVILSDAELERLLVAARTIDAEGAWDGHLFNLVAYLAATGARFSQIARCTVGEFQPELERLMVVVSQKGQGVKEKTHIAFPLDRSLIVELQPLIEGRMTDELLLQRWAFARPGGKAWSRSHLRGWRPAEITKPFRKIVDRAGLPPKVTAYALRHTSIVRCLRRRLPVRLVASMHDTSTDMIERHYSAHIDDALSDVMKLAVIRLNGDSQASAHPVSDAPIALTTSGSN